MTAADVESAPARRRLAETIHQPPNAWMHEAVRRIERDFQRSADTHLVLVEVAGLPQVPLYLKDESTHPTGSLKHRLARSLFLYALCNGWIREGTPIIEASSGSTAVSEAYFARMLDLPFVAVMPRLTSPAKVGQIEFYGGRCHFVERGDEVYAEAKRLADDCGGHYMDQFTYAERATDWRGNNNIAESIFEQMRAEPHPVPRWIVVGAGTGGTSATIGRYIRYQGWNTGLCVVDPENSVFYDYSAQPRSDAHPCRRFRRRRHRPAACRAFLRAGRDRSDDPRVDAALPMRRCGYSPTWSADAMGAPPEPTSTVRSSSPAK